VPILHIASHGIVDLSSPESSFLALSDGPLTAGELYEKGQFRFGLVVLSACQTGLGGRHPDSAIGLSNAFLIGGSRTVLSTLWQVPDEGTAQLMIQFYEELLKGKPVSTSLRQAQLSALADKSRKHPIYWAAFKCSGLDANPLMNREAK
jgi:CHAT domain-containing protein